MPLEVLGDQPSPFKEQFHDPDCQILSTEKNFGKYLGITEASTEISSAGSEVAMRSEDNYGRLFSFNRGPGVKMWTVIENQHTVTTGRILKRHKFRGYEGKVNHHKITV